MKIIYIALYLFSIAASLATARQCLLSNNARLDCFPQDGADQQNCEARGCCWSPPSVNLRFPLPLLNNVPINIPYCYYPLDYENYQVSSHTATNRGYTINIQRSKSTYLPNEILKLSIQIIYETNERLRIRIIDPNNARFEPPIELSPPDKTIPKNMDYEVVFPTQGNFELEIRRKSDKLSLFKTAGPLLYSDQFIQIALNLSAKKGYGIGEQNVPLMYDLTKGWTRMGFWAHDNPIGTYQNLYGTHPVFFALPDNTKAYGLYFFNSNAIEFNTQPGQILTYRTIGGVLDMFVFSGGSLQSSVQQYQNLIGRPMLPPFWVLGFHLSRYGYKGVQDMSDTLKRNLAATIPIEVQWSDIDYMDKYKDFTVDSKNFNTLGKYVNTINKNFGVKCIVIIDPALSIQPKGVYPAYDEGLMMNVFVRDSRNNKPLVGKVWPGNAVYPDFTHPNSTSFWTKQIQTFLKSVPVDGLWIDMNEPSNFYDGSATGCPNSKYNTPFFVPKILDNSLIKKTVCGSALHYRNVPHYNLHNLYGFTEARVTHAALNQTSGGTKRVFVLTRSSFSGSGKYTFHWTGDNTANWEQLSNSIRQVLNFNMYGIPMVGADICGFLGDTNEELCVRWMQLGAFYPFMRNHNDRNSINQDPASFSKPAQDAMRSAILIRYTLIPYFYTLIVKSHLTGSMIVKPLGFEFAEDSNTHAIEHQFMLGSAVLVNPAVKQGATSVSAYFPAGIWYDMYDSKVVFNSTIGANIALPAPLNKINIAIRDGFIIPLMQPALNTDAMRKNNKMIIYCILPQNSGNSSGDMYWDDGVSLDSYTSNKYTYLKFSANQIGLDVTPTITNYKQTPTIVSIVVVGLYQKSIETVLINGKSYKFLYTNGILILSDSNISPLATVKMVWK